MQDECGALFLTEPFEQVQERHRQVAGQFRFGFRCHQVRIGQRLGQPWAYVDLAPGLG